MKHGLCTVIIAAAAILAIAGGFRFVSSSAVRKDSSVAAAVVIDDRGDYTTTGESKDASTDPEKYASVKFEVSGKVQGVSFRKHAKAKAEELGLTGWCRNTPRGTVEGAYEYDVPRGRPSSPSSNEEGDEGSRGTTEAAAAAFRRWLCEAGSPRSSVEGCAFSEEAVSNARNFDQFRVVQ